MDKPITLFILSAFVLLHFGVELSFAEPREYKVGPGHSKVFPPHETRTPKRKTAPSEPNPKATLPDTATSIEIAESTLPDSSTSLGSAEMGYLYPFEASTKDDLPVMVTRAEVFADAMVVSLSEGPDYKRRSMEFKFIGVMNGTDPQYSDSDSHQVAILWKDKEGKVIGRATNATLQSSRKTSKNPAANWKVLQKSEPTKLFWETKVPPGATQMEVVSIFTDSLLNPPQYVSRSKTGIANQGDLPLVTSSFSGKFENGKWSITALPEDVTTARKFTFGKYPKVNELPEHVAAVRKLLEVKTQYKLIKRPQSLEGVHSPQDKTKDEISDLIEADIKAKNIQSHHDSGFDIDPSSQAQD